MTSLLLLTEGFVNDVLSRSSFKTPVFSNFFLNRFKALSIDSFSLMLIISMFHYLGCKYTSFHRKFPRLTSKSLWRSPISVFPTSPPRWCKVLHRGRTSPRENL